MIKQLLFTAALLVPGLAYAGNPSADLSIQVVPAGTAGTCGTIMGQAGTDATAAGFTTCALYNDFTTQIPNTVGTGLPSNWLNCSTTSDAGGVWNWYGGTSSCPRDVTQVTDPTYGNLALDMHFSSAYLAAGQSNVTWLSSVPDSGSNNPSIHSFSTGYFEWTYRWTSDSGNFPGNVESYWSWTCCGTGDNFVDLEFLEDFGTGGGHTDYGWNFWPSGQLGKVVHYPAFNNATYNTIGVILTGNNTNFAVCGYFNGTRIECDNQSYQAGMNATQRRQIYLGNGIQCGYDSTVITCIPPNFGNSNLYIQDIKILTCSAEPTGGNCLGNTYNGNFYTP